MRDLLRRYRAARDRLAAHLGNRGDVLVTFGAVWVVIGISVPTAPTPAEPHVHEMLPDPLRVALWVIPGVYALAVGLRGRGVPDAIAFALLVIAPTVRSASYAWSWVVWWLPPPLDGDQRGWVGAAIWLLVARLVRRIAGWKEDRSARDRRDVGGGIT